MTRLHDCPVCGKKPKINPKLKGLKEHKYFCSVHLSCGDWFNQKKKAKKDWNRRVKEYKAVKPYEGLYGSSLSTVEKTIEIGEKKLSKEEAFKFIEEFF